MRVVCRRCGFQFECSETKKACNYCGERNSLELVKEAEELIDEIKAD